MTTEKIHKEWASKHFCIKCGKERPAYPVEKSGELLDWLGTQKSSYKNLWLCIACVREFSFHMGRHKRG